MAQRPPDAPTRAPAAPPTADADGGHDLLTLEQLSEVSGVPARNVASWDGSTWQALGPGIERQVNALTIAQGGLCVAGPNTEAGGVPCRMWPAGMGRHGAHRGRDADPPRPARSLL